MKPPRSILDKAFVYVPAARTDVAKTFKRIRDRERANAKEVAAVVAPITRKVRTA